VSLFGGGVLAQASRSMLDEAIQFLRLGEVDQWVMIRGGRVTNPPSMLLRGGPV
jgi:hypothetical protein